MQFVVNVTNQKVICHDNNQLLAFGTGMLPPPEGLLTRLSMIVALVFGRCMLTYGMWQWGHTGAAGRTILMMITKKERWAAKRSTVCQDLSLCKRQEWYKSFHQKHLSFTKPCWLAMKSLTDAHHLVRDQETRLFSDKTEHFQTVLWIEHIARNLVAVHTESIFVFTNCMMYRCI